MASKELDRSEWPLMSRVFYEVGIIAVSVVISFVIIVALRKLGIA